MSPIVKRDLMAHRGSPILNSLMPPNETDQTASQRTRTHTPIRSQSLVPGCDKDEERKIDILSSVGISEARSRENIDGQQLEGQDTVEEDFSPVKVIAHRKSSPSIFKGFLDFEQTLGTLEEEKESLNHQKSFHNNKQVDTRTTERQNNDSTCFLNIQNVSTINATRILLTNGPKPKTDVDISAIEHKEDEEEKAQDMSIEKFQPEVKLTKLDSAIAGDDTTKGKKRWGRISLLFQSLLLLNREEVKPIDDAKGIFDEINNYNLRKWKQPVPANKKRDLAVQDFAKEAFEFVRRVQAFCECASIGSAKHVGLMKQILDEDPKKFMLETSDPSHIVNHKNHLGQTPLHIAAKNGNLEVIKFLIANKANYNLESEVEHNVKETALEAAIRWNHGPAIDYLLSNCEYDSKVVIKGLKIATTKSTKDLLKRHVKSKCERVKMLLFCCFDS